jgi:hypothetical protein
MYNFPENLLAIFLTGTYFSNIVPYALFLALGLPLLLICLSIIFIDKTKMVRSVLSLVAIIFLFSSFLFISLVDHDTHDCKVVLGIAGYKIDDKIVTEETQKFICRVRPIGSMKWSDWKLK